MESKEAVRMNVKFLNTPYRPSDEELRKLRRMQETIHYTRIQYLYEIRHDSPRMQAARIEHLHRMYRDRWNVISNACEDLTEKITH
jgi:hypothetical protein